MPAVVEDVGVGCEGSIARPVVTHELPEVLDRVSSGERAGNGSRVMLAGTARFFVVCQPA